MKINAMINGISVPVDVADERVFDEYLESFLDEQKDEFVKETIYSVTEDICYSLSDGDISSIEDMDDVCSLYDDVYRAIIAEGFPYIVNDYEQLTRDIIYDAVKEQYEKENRKDKYYTVNVEMAVRTTIYVKAKSEEEAEQIANDLDYDDINSFDIIDSEITHVYVYEEVDENDIESYETIHSRDD